MPLYPDTFKITKPSLAGAYEAGQMPVTTVESTKTPEQIEAEQKAREEQDELFVFDKVKTRLQQMKQSWTYELAETVRRRFTRSVDINPKALRDTGELLPDETMVPIRVIDTNISREKPSFINFLKGTGRIAVFHCITDPSQNTQPIEEEFSRGLTYVDWDKPHYKCLDGAQTHGWDSMEIVYDETKPFNIALEHIGHEKLLFPLDALELQSCPMILREYSFSLLQLKKGASRHGFSEAQVKLLEDRLNSGATSGRYGSNGANPKDRNVTIYKKYCKYEGIVYASWFNLDVCTDWLKAPMPLYIGRKQKKEVQIDVPNPVAQSLGIALDSSMVPPTIKQTVTRWEDRAETDYPIFILPYSETEEQEVSSHKGRVYYDQHKQEAQTAIASGYINGLNRAANVYGSVENTDPGATSAPAQLDTKLQSGAIYDKKINFWGTNYPDPAVLAGLQWFNTQNSDEVGQVNFAVNNRQDSRKTATENVIANQQQSALSSVQVGLYSSWLRSIYTFTWPVVQSRALAGLITFLSTKVGEDVDMVTGQPKPIYRNNDAIIALEYDIKAAGDIDVIQRTELLGRMKQDWPVISQTPLSAQFLQEMIKVSYPQQASKWNAILEQGDVQKNLIAQMAMILKTLVTPAEIATLSPQEQQQLMQIQQQTEQILNPQQQTK